jgi:hypothetical protein
MLVIVPWAGGRYCLDLSSNFKAPFGYPQSGHHDPGKFNHTHSSS